MRLFSVAGNGISVGFGDGDLRRGQVHGGLVGLSGACVSLSERGVSVALQAASGLVELRGGSHPPWERS